MKAALAATVALASLAGATQASAAQILNPTGNITLYTLTGSENLTDASFAGAVYLFYEGTYNNVASYLLHYDRTLRSPREQLGAFDILLGAGESFLGVAQTTAALDATDPSNGVTYPTGFVSARGLEDSGSFVDWVSSSTPNPVQVNFGFNTSALARDEVRFLVGVASVPEPATWAMMLVGFGAIGAVMRRRQRATVGYNFA